MLFIVDSTVVLFVTNRYVLLYNCFGILVCFSWLWLQTKGKRFL